MSQNDPLNSNGRSLTKEEVEILSEGGAIGTGTDCQALISLAEYRGETRYYVVPRNVYEWIVRPYGKHYKSTYEDPIPEHIRRWLSQYGDVSNIPSFVEVTRGSPENDRALQLSDYYPVDFGSISEVDEYCNNNGLVIINTFEGLVY